MSALLEMRGSSCPKRYKSDVTVILVAKDQPVATMLSVATLYRVAEAGSKAARVILVDNGSTEAAVGEIFAHFQTLFSITEVKRISPGMIYADCIQEIIRTSGIRTKWVLLLDNDTRICCPELLDCAQRLAAQGQVVCVGERVPERSFAYYWGDDAPHGDYVGLETYYTCCLLLRAKIAEYYAMKGQLAHRWDLDRKQFDETCAQAIRESILDEGYQAIDHSFTQCGGIVHYGSLTWKSEVIDSLPEEERQALQCKIERAKSDLQSWLEENRAAEDEQLIQGILDIENR